MAYAEVNIRIEGGDEKKIALFHLAHGKREVGFSFGSYGNACLCNACISDAFDHNINELADEGDERGSPDYWTEDMDQEHRRNELRLQDRRCFLRGIWKSEVFRSIADREKVSLIIREYLNAIDLAYSKKEMAEIEMILHLEDD